MKSLYDLINEELTWLAKNKYTKYDNLDLFITDDRKSADFINSLTKYNKFETPGKNSNLYQIAQGRARHSAITFLTGLVFKKFGGIYDNIDNVLNQQGTAFKLWLMTSLNHDIGYTSSYIMRGDLNYQKKFKYYLLSNNYNNVPILNNFDKNYPNCMAYSYQEIINYDRYSRDYHKMDDDGRRLDHGILGGMILFNKLIKIIKESKFSQNHIDPLIIKASALTVAQHNIYKSSNKEHDKKYIDCGLNRLVSTLDFMIEQSYSLLLLLSLVDTIECVKKYSKKENEKNSMQTITVLKNIMVEVSKNEIIIDYTSLSKREKQKRNNDYICRNVIRNIMDLKHWTCFNITLKDNIAHISLYSEHQKQEVKSKISA